MVAVNHRRTHTVCRPKQEYKKLAPRKNASSKQIYKRDSINKNPQPVWQAAALTEHRKLWNRIVCVVLWNRKKSLTNMAPKESSLERCQLPVNANNALFGVEMPSSTLWKPWIVTRVGWDYLTLSAKASMLNWNSSKWKMTGRLCLSFLGVKTSLSTLSPGQLACKASKSAHSPLPSKPSS